MIKRIKNILKKEYFIREIVTLFVIVTSMLGFVLFESLAVFSGTIEKTSVASLETGAITFDITSTNESYNTTTKQITIPAGETVEMDMTIKNTTPIPAKYKFYYKIVGGSSTTEKNLAYTGSIQTYTIPETGTYTIEAAGAEGTQGNKYSYTGTATPTPGKGAKLTSEFSLTKNDVLTVVVGGVGSITQATSKDGTSGAGGGGSFVFKGISSVTDSTYQITKSSKYYETLLVAAGGGGTGDSSYKGAATNGYDGVGATWISPGGTAYSTTTSNGTTSSSQSSPLGISQFITYDSIGGYYTRNSGVCRGGFGGGGCADDNQSYGGGWSGSSYQTQSFSSGSNTSGVTGSQSGNGYVKITSSSSSNKELTEAEKEALKQYITATIITDTEENYDTGVLETNKTAIKSISLTNSSTQGITLEVGVEGGYQNNSVILSSGNSSLAYEILYKDESGANEPILADGMIPVVYNDTDDVWKVADISSEWYNYNNQWWANAVTVSDASLRSATPGTTLPMEKINTMWVWIPRYKYKITSNIGSSSAVTSPPQIDVVFESGTNTTGTALASCSITATNCYYTHPAFRNGSSVYKTSAYDQGGWDEELEGIWVGKFETSIDGSVTTDSSNTCYSSKSETNCDTSNLTPIIKPDVESLNHQSVGNQFLTSLKFTNGTKNTSTGEVTFSTNSNNIYGLNTKSNTTDTHMMKNTEWGAVAYLSQSKYGKYGNTNYTGSNKEIYINNSYSSSGYKIYTGRSSGFPSEDSYSASGTYSYNDLKCSDTTSKVVNRGKGASTTGTIYGIYDMSGGADEYVMGNWTGTVDLAGFSSFPTNKYYDKYTGTSSSSITSAKAIKGDATYEPMRWYSDYGYFVTAGYPWFDRGGNYKNAASSGVFSLNNASGEADYIHSFRTTLIP